MLFNGRWFSSMNELKKFWTKKGGYHRRLRWKQFRELAIKCPKEGLWFWY